MKHKTEKTKERYEEREREGVCVLWCCMCFIEIQDVEQD